MRVHNSLREARLKRSLTQEALAGIVGVTRQTVIAIEKEKFVPSIRLALQLALAMDTRVEDLFWIEGRPGDKR